MLIHKTYKTIKEKDLLISEMLGKGFTQVSSEGIFIGEGHLLFTDEKPEPEPQRDPLDEIDDLTEWAKTKGYTEKK